MVELRAGDIQLMLVVGFGMAAQFYTAYDPLIIAPRSQGDCLILTLV